MKSTFVVSILCLCIRAAVSRPDEIWRLLNSREKPSRDLLIEVEEVKLPSRGHHELKNHLSELHGNNKLRHLSESKNSQLNLLTLENVLKSLQNRHLERDIQQAKDTRQELIDIEIRNRSPSITPTEKISLRNRDILKDSRSGLSKLENTLKLLRNLYLDQDVRQNKNSELEVINKEVDIIVPKSRRRQKSSSLQLDALQNTNQNSVDLENVLDLLRQRNLDRGVQKHKNSQLEVIDEKVEIILPKSRQQKSSSLQLGTLQSTHKNSVDLENVLDLLRKLNLEREVRGNKNSQLEVIDEKIEIILPKSRREKSSSLQLDTLQSTNKNSVLLENVLDLLRQRNLDREVRDNKNSQLEVIDEKVEIIVPKSRRQKSSLRQLDDLQNSHQHSLELENALDLLRKRNLDREVRDNKNSQLEVIDEKVEIIVPKSRRQKNSLRQLDDLQNSNQNSLELENTLDLLRNRNLDREVRDNKNSQLEVIDEKVEIIVPKSRRQKSSLRQLDDLQNSNKNSLELENALDLLRKLNLDREVRDNKNSQLEVIDEKVEIILPKSRQQKSSSLQLDHLQNTNQNSLDFENALDLLRNHNLDQDIQEINVQNLLNSDPIKLSKPPTHSLRRTDSSHLQDSLSKLAEIIGVLKSAVIANERTENPSTSFYTKLSTNDARLKITEIVELLKSKIKERKQNEIPLLKDILEDPLLKLAEVTSRKRSNLPQVRLSANKNNDLDIADARLQAAKIIDESKSEIIGDDQLLILELAELIANEQASKPSGHLSSGLENKKTRLKVAELISVPKSVRITKEQRIPSKTIVSKHGSRNPYEIDVVTVEEPDGNNKKVMKKNSKIVFADKKALFNQLNNAMSKIPNLTLVIQTPESPISNHEFSVLRNSVVVDNAIIDAANAVSAAATALASAGSLERSRENSPSIDNAANIASSAAAEASALAAQAISYIIESQDKKSDNPSLVISSESLAAAAAALENAAKTVETVSISSVNHALKHSPKATDKIKEKANTEMSFSAAGSSTAETSSAASSSSVTSSLSASEQHQHKNHHRQLSKFETDVILASLALAQAQAAEVKSQTNSFVATEPTHGKPKLINLPLVKPPKLRSSVLKSPGVGSVTDKTNRSGTSADTSTIVCSEGSGSGTTTYAAATSNTESGGSGSVTTSAVAATSNTGSGGLGSGAATSATATSDTGSGAATSAAATSNTGSGSSESGVSTSATATSDTGSGAATSAAVTSNSESGGSGTSAASSAAATSNTGSGSLGSGATTSAPATSNIGSGSLKSGTATSNIGSKSSGSGSATSNTVSGSSESATATSAAATSNTGSGAATSAAATANTGSGGSGSAAAASAAVTTNTRSGGSGYGGEKSAAATSLTRSSSAGSGDAASAVARSNTESGAVTPNTISDGTGSGATASAASTSNTGFSGPGSGSTASGAATSIVATTNAGSDISSSGAAVSAVVTLNTRSGDTISNGKVSGASASTAASTAASSEVSETGAETSDSVSQSDLAVSSGSESDTATSTVEKSNGSQSAIVTSSTSSTASSSSKSDSSSAISTTSSTSTASAAAASSTSTSSTSLSKPNEGDTSSKFQNKNLSSPKLTIIETEDKDEDKVVIVVGTRDKEEYDQD